MSHRIQRPNQSLTIARRFRGPPGSGNGGYVCGLIGKRFRGAAEVRLLKPPPLNKPLALHQGDDKVQLLDGELIIAEGYQCQLDQVAPACPELPWSGPTRQTMRVSLTMRFLDALYAARSASRRMDYVFSPHR